MKLKRMLGLLFAVGIIMVFFIGMGTVLAQRTVIADGQCGVKADWHLYSDGELVISGSGEMDEFYGTSPWHNWRTSIEKVTIGENITRIGNYTFNEYTNLISVEMPGVTYIGKGAFFGCSKLTSVYMPKIVFIFHSAFADCSSLTSVDMPDVATIGNYAFSY